MDSKLRVLVGCESSGTVRRAFRELGHDAWSCDLFPAQDGSPFHYQCDVRGILDKGWDLMVAHPDCTYLTNAGVRWLHTKEGRWEKMAEAADFYFGLWRAPIPHIALENPVWHRYAKAAIPIVQKRQIVQPWWFGDETFKATGWHRKGLPELVPTNKLVPPKPGTAEHKRWSWVHRCPPGADRWRIRSQFHPGMAAALAEQWSFYVQSVK